MRLRTFPALAVTGSQTVFDEGVCATTALKRRGRHERYSVMIAQRPCQACFSTGTTDVNRFDCDGKVQRLEHIHLPAVSN
jgi:hypothetical protein